MIMAIRGQRLGHVLHSIREGMKHKKKGRGEPRSCLL